MSWQAYHDWLTQAGCGATLRADGALEVLACGDPAAEYAALRQHVALLVSPTLSPFLIEGADAASYLHRRLSASIKGLELGLGTRALQLGGDGLMQADVLLWCGEEAFVALAERTEAEAARTIIEKYTLADDVTTTDLAADEAVLALAGPGARALLENHLDGSAARQVLARGAWAAVLSATLGGLPCRVLGDGRWGMPFYHLAIPLGALPAVAAAFTEACEAAGGRTAGLLAVERLRIERGITRHGIDTNAKTIPLEAGLQSALDYNKGCYPGQEIIARITNLGHPARALVRLVIDGEHEALSEKKIFVQGRESGWLTSHVSWPGRGCTDVLGYLKWADRGAAVADVTIENKTTCVLLVEALVEWPEKSQSPESKRS